MSSNPFDWFHTGRAPCEKLASRTVLAQDFVYFVQVLSLVQGLSLEVGYDDTP